MTEADLLTMFAMLALMAVTVVSLALLADRARKVGRQNLFKRFEPAQLAQGGNRTVEFLKRVPKTARVGCLLAVGLFLLVPPFRYLVYVGFFLLSPLVPFLLVGGGLLLSSRSQSISGLATILSPINQPLPQLTALFEHDPNFSLPVFREFAVLLYSQAIQERTCGFPHSRPYLSEAAVRALTRRSQASEISDVVVGTCSLVSASVQGGKLNLQVSLESNYLEKLNSGEKAVMANEQWTFSRKLGSLTKIPEGASKLACPGCGFSGDFPSSGECPQCGRTNQQGQLDWLVSTIQVIQLEPFKPHQAEGSGQEVGTNIPTVIHPQLSMRRRELEARHPDFQLCEFEQKVREIFLAINNAWNDRDWSKARPYETDALFRTHRYWIEDYLRKGQINQLGQIQLSQAVLSNIVLDAFYESITVRIYASMTDCTVDAQSGRVLFGDSKRPRAFSEYWTFVRRVGSKLSKSTTSQCPSCGASLDRVNQAGICEYCDSLITRGDFGWVLSNIEQDEVYRTNY